MVDTGPARDDGSVMPADLRNKRFAIGLAAVTLGAFALRLFLLTNIARRDPTGGDPFYYHAQANFLVEGHGFSDPFIWAKFHRMVPSAIHPPLFSLWLAIPSFFGFKGYLAHKVMSCIAGALAVLLIGILGREVGGRRVGLIAAVVASVYPPLWSIDGQLWPEGLFTAIVAGLCICAYRAWRKPGWRWAAALGAMLALAALTRGEAIALGVLLVAPMLLLRRTVSWKINLRDLAVATGACLVLLAPWMIRNATTFTHFVPLSTNSDEVLVYANNPYTYGEKDGNTFLGFWNYPWQDELRAQNQIDHPTWEGGEHPGDASVRARYWREQGVHYAKTHKRLLPKVLAARVGRAWNLYAPFQNARFDLIDGKNLRVSQAGVWAWWLALALSIPGLVILRRRRVPIIPFVALAATVTLTALYAYGANRFRTPLDLAAIVLASVTIGAALQRWAPDLLRWPRIDRLDALAVGIIAFGFALPLRGLLRYQGPPMEEGFMLTFPQEVLRGAVPNKDFLHLYGPGSLWVLAGVFKVFGTSLATERFFGLLQHAGIVFGVFAIGRRWGRKVAVVCGLASLVIVLPPIGLTALAWNGGVALGVWTMWTITRSIHPSDRTLVLAGFLAGLTLLYRPDLILALTFGLTAALWRPTLARLRPLALGAAAGLAPILLQLFRAGPRNMIRGMFVDPVFRLRPGRSLPVPPSFNTLDGWLQKAAGLRTLGWPLPAPSSAQQVFIWFFLVPASAFFVAAVGVWAVRREPDSVRTRTLRAIGFFGVGMLTQAMQRPDTAHFAWVSCVPMALVPAAIAELVRGRPWPSWSRTVATASPVAIVIVLLIPHYTVRTYVDLTGQSFGRNVFGFPVNHDGRNFYYGSPEAAAAANELVADLGQKSVPGQRLFVGPMDLRQTPYSDAFYYYLFPHLVPATYFIEMDPGIANAPGSRLTADVESADWLILSNVWTGWTEPNASRDVGSDEPNQAVAKDFCLVKDYGDKGGGQPWFQLYRRCAKS